MTCADCGSPCQGNRCRDCARDRHRDPGDRITIPDSKEDDGDA